MLIFAVVNMYHIKTPPYLILSKVYLYTFTKQHSWVLDLLILYKPNIEFSKLTADSC